jgi:diguanylate cyclase (GGDEF)-like protein
MRLFCGDGGRAGDAWDLYEDYLREASDDMLNRLPQSGPAHRKRAAEHVSKLEAEGRREFERAVEQLERESDGTESGAFGSAELDDRLPLGRRAAFDRDLAGAVREAKRTNRPCALIMADIDHFKNVNDRHGHPVGDEVLIAVAERLVERIGHRGKAYRYGGEEFAVLLPGYSAEEAYGMAERLRKDIEREPVSSKALCVTASFGTVSVPEEATDARQLLKRADAALYKAKRAGRNRVRIGPASG